MGYGSWGHKELDRTEHSQSATEGSHGWLPGGGIRAGSSTVCSENL